MESVHVIVFVGAKGHYGDNRARDRDKPSRRYSALVSLISSHPSGSAYGCHSPEFTDDEACRGDSAQAIECGAASPASPVVMPLVDAVSRRRSASHPHTRPALPS